ncbi:MAG: TraB/GumN family protein [Planctomycetota bacterium]
MIRSVAASILSLILILGLVSCGEPATTQLSAVELDHPSFLWEVEKDGSHAWLFGTMHFTDPEVTTLGQEVDDAITAADAIFTEVEETPSSGAFISTAGRLPSGESLSDLVPAELLQSLHAYLQSRGLPPSSMDQWRPWMVSVQIGLLDAIPFMSDGQKLDVQLMHRAKNEGKEFGAIEKTEDQLRALTVGSVADQVHMLGVTLEKLVKEQANGASSLAKLRDLYLAGDEDALWKFAMSETDLDDPIQIDWLHAILQERNLLMAQRIHARLQEFPERSTFFAFGALHFVGPDSVGEHLKSLGYTVTRVQHIAPAMD